MSRSLAIGLVCALASSAHGYGILPYDPMDAANWVEVQFVESPADGIDYVFRNTFNGSLHHLADTGGKLWRGKNVPAPVEPHNTFALGLNFTEAGNALNLDFAIRGDEQGGPSPVTITIGAETLVPGPGVNQLRRARNFTIASSFGTRSSVAFITAPEPSSLALLGLAAIALRRRRC